MEKSIKLNLGSSGYKNGWINVDANPKVKADIHRRIEEPLPFKENSVDKILLGHIIEHFRKEGALGLLKYWRTLLKKGGELVIECPNAYTYVKEYNNPKYKVSWDEVLNAFYTLNPTSPLNKHKWGYSQETLKQLIQEAGYNNIVVGPGTDGHVTERRPKEFFIRLTARKS